MCDGKSENTNRNSSFFCSHMGGKRKHHQVPRQCALYNCLLPNRGTSRTIPAGPGRHKVRKNCTPDWSKPVMVWKLFAPLAAGKWTSFKEWNRTQGRHQCSIFTGKQWKVQRVWQSPTETQSLRKYSLPVHKQDVSFQTESIPWWCQHRVPKMDSQEWRLKLSKLTDNLISIKAQF